MLNRYDDVVTRMGTRDQQPRDAAYVMTMLQAHHALLRAWVDGLDVATLAREYLDDQRRDSEVLDRIAQLRNSMMARKASALTIAAFVEGRASVPLNVACPVCLAKVGMKCTDQRRGVIKTVHPHAERKVLAAQEYAAWQSAAEAHYLPGRWDQSVRSGSQRDDRGIALPEPAYRDDPTVTGR